jgi:Reverse transcriptase (RNA-dependent DNA polymerase).
LYDILIKFGVPRKLVRLIKKCLDGTLSKEKIGNYLSYNFPTENGLKQGDALSPLFLNFSLEYAIRKVQETTFGLDTNGTHQVLAYVDDVNLIGQNNNIRIERNADVLLNACKDIGLAVNTVKLSTRK